MALIALCWLIVESFVVPRGLLKWFYLSFYINPVFLFFCQVFLWLKQLKKLLIYFFYPLTFAFRLILHIFGLLRNVVFVLFFYARPTRSDVYYDALKPDVSLTCLNDSQIVVSCRKLTSGLYPNLDTYQATEETYDDSCVAVSWLNEYLFSDHYCSSAIMDVVHMSHSILSNEGVTKVGLLDQHKCTSSFSFTFTNQFVDRQSSNETEESLINNSCHAFEPPLLKDMLVISEDFSVSPDLGVSPLNQELVIMGRDVQVDNVSPVLGVRPLNQELVMSGDVQDDKFSPVLGVRPLNRELVIMSGYVHDVDAFHHMYTSRVRFFDVLYHERLHGINAILNEHLSTPYFLSSIEKSTDYPMQCVVLSRMARKRVLRSLEFDLEIICVGQLCLFWEALDHQYHKVKSLVLSDNYENILLDHNVSGKFQQIEILLTRFVEDERCEFKGSSSSTSKRLSFHSLLRIPHVTEFVRMEEKNKTVSEDDCMRPAQLLEVIDNCINAFWSYIKTDDKKPRWKYKGIWRGNLPVEDPQDLELLYGVAKILHKKEIILRNMQGKSKCWIRKIVKVVAAENENTDLLFAMIDVKLVQMILKMSLINRSHLKWCQQKLDNIDSKQDIVFRGRTSRLFHTS